MVTPGLRQALRPTDTVGPILYLHGVDGANLHVAALLAAPAKAPPPTLETRSGPVSPEQVRPAKAGRRISVYHFTLPLGGTADYRVDGATYTVNTDFYGDPRLACVSCNGQKRGDREGAPDERNYRVLERRDDAWRPQRMLEDDGLTPAPGLGSTLAGGPFPGEADAA